MQGRNRHADTDNGHVNTEGEERVGQVKRAALKHDYHMYKRSPVVICCLMQGAQHGAL